MLTTALSPPTAIVVLQANYYSAATFQLLCTKLVIRLGKISVSFPFFLRLFMIKLTAIVTTIPCHSSLQPVLSVFRLFVYLFLFLHLN